MKTGAPDTKVLPIKNTLHLYLPIPYDWGTLSTESFKCNSYISKFQIPANFNLKFPTYFPKDINSSKLFV